jgi:hypothetical protein
VNKLIQAKVDSVMIRNSKKGDAGFNVVCLYDDGSDYGKRIFQWLWRGGNNVDKNLLDWAKLVDPNNEEASAVDVLLSGKLSDLVVDLLVDDSDGQWWRIQSVGLQGTIEAPEVETVADDDIPF